MRTLKRTIAGALIVLLLLTQFSTVAFALTDTQVEHLEKILGVYDGSYTATQGLTGLTLSVYRTKDLLNDETLLQKYADVANSCSVSSASDVQEFTAEDIKSIISQHSGDYIALFNFFPMVEEDGSVRNPDVEEGLYTMTVTYIESTGKYEFIGSQWIQRDTYEFADLKNIVLENGALSGDVYGNYASWFWVEYGDIGDVMLLGGDGHSGYRIDFENSSASLGVNEKQKIRAVVKNHDGVPAGDAVGIKWFSGNESIATISGENWGGSGSEYASGTIVGVSEGVTEIYAKLDNNRVAICSVIVSENGTIAPLEITTGYELITQITDGRFAPQYKITATVKNPDTSAADNVVATLYLPETASVCDEKPLSVTIDQLASNESCTLTWNIVTEGDYFNTTEIFYSVSAGSDRTVERYVYKTIFVEPFAGNDNRIVYGTDTWDFTNNTLSFNKGYYINDWYYASFMNEISNTEKEWVDKQINGDWGGSCYGMSAVMALTKIGYLTPSIYHEDALTLNELPAPKNSDEVYSLINYYHMTQFLDAFYAAKYERMAIAEKEQLMQLVKAVEAVKVGGAPVLICFYWMKDNYVEAIDSNNWYGHAILGYDVEYGSWEKSSLVDSTKTEYDKRIVIYDPNDKDNPIYFYINEDYTKWKIGGYCQNRISEDGLYWYKNEGTFFFVDDPAIMDLIHVEDAKLNYSARLQANTSTKLMITMRNADGSSDAFAVQGMNVTGSAADDIIACPDAINADGTASGIGYFIPETVTGFTVVPDGGTGTLDVNYTYPDASYSVSSQSGESVSFSEDNSVVMDCNGEYTVTAVYNEYNYATPWYYYSITGMTDGSIGLSQDADGYTIISCEDLDGVELTVRGHSGEAVQEINTDEDEVLVKDENGEIALYVDTDDDGTFETLLQSEEIQLGDVNGDGDVDIFDANLVVGYYNGTTELSETQIKAADVNGDGDVDIFDANLIVAYYNGTAVLNNVWQKAADVNGNDA